MAKKRKDSHRHAGDDSEQMPKQKPVSFSPFKDLKKMLADKAGEAAKHTPPAKPAVILKPVITKPIGKSSAPAPAREVIDETAILREAYAGVRPLGNATTGHRMPVVPEVHLAVVSEEAEVLAALSDLVSGVGTFDLTETEEYVEGARVGLDPRLLSRLRRGEFAVQDHIDLHGMIQPDAKLALREFIPKSVSKGIRTVLVVHGRGLGSPGGRPILKHATAQWLSHGEIGAHVHAFATARPQDGGAGAMYVLLRRDRRRAAFDVLQGAKRRD
jgi:DNA-nicking Smr family endonuclease